MGTSFFDSQTQSADNANFKNLSNKNAGVFFLPSSNLVKYGGYQWPYPYLQGGRDFMQSILSLSFSLTFQILYLFISYPNYIYFGDYDSLYKATA